MNVLHLPTSVGGNSFGLSRGERRLGLNSDVLLSRQNWLNYEYDLCLYLDDRNFLDRLYQSFKTFNNVKGKYDVFHFNYGSSLLDFQKIGLFLLDLPFYPKSAKKVITYNGSDARGVHPVAYWPELGCPKQSFYERLAIQLKKNKIKRAAKYVDHIFALNPDLLNYLPEKTQFLPYSIASWDMIDRVDKNILAQSRIKVVHSPTSRDLKGSIYIIEAMKVLCNRYSFIDFEIIENLPHSVAIEKYKSADLILDQVLIGWYGAFGVEAMKMGIPLAVNIRNEDLRFIPYEMARDLEHAIINITPFNIEDKLAEIFEAPQMLIQKREAALEYVHKWHDPLYVAGITKSVYES